MFGEILIRRENYAAGLALELPSKILLLDKVDFSRGNMIFTETETINRKEFKKLKPAEVPSMGLNKHGGLETDVVETISLAQAIVRTQTQIQACMPAQLTGTWYLTATQRWHAVRLTNGDYLAERNGNDLELKTTRTTMRPVVVDPVSWTKSGDVLFPLATALQLLEIHDGVLADPYAWTKRFIPEGWGRGGKHEPILVIGPKTV